MLTILIAYVTVIVLITKFFSKATKPDSLEEKIFEDAK